ncbi:MAG: DUF349 domain-containing protein [Flavobacteriaceae bacterium]
MESNEKHVDAEAQSTSALVFTLPDLEHTSYEHQSLENLVGELQRLIKNAPIQRIGQHIIAIKSSFDSQFNTQLESEKESFLEQGNPEADFEFNPLIKRQFDELYQEYKEKKAQYRKDFERLLQDNLKRKQEIIEGIKALLEAEENINTTFQTFKQLQSDWRSVGMVPKTYTEDLWANYHHHVERFYDFLDLNRELRDLDFKHNYEEKLKIIERTEALLGEKDFKKAYAELQELHRIWKEELGPVSKELRQEVWERFSSATKQMHDKKQQILELEDREREENLAKKQEILSRFQETVGDTITTQKELKDQVKTVEELKNSFYAVGPVPKKNQKLLSKQLRELFRQFNQAKNAFYKEQKKVYQENLTKKRALIEQAESLKERTDFKVVTPLIKELQQEWKQTGHVPRKYSEPLWEAFRGACNAYFERLKSQKNNSRAQFNEQRKQLSTLIETLESFTPSKNKDADFQQLYKLKDAMNKHLGSATSPQAQKAEKAMQKALKEAGFTGESFAAEMSAQRIEQLKETSSGLNEVQSTRAEVKKQIDRLTDEIRLLETNLEFFSSSSSANTLLDDAKSKLEQKISDKEQWKAKLKELNVIKHRIEKADEEAESAEGEELSESTAD